MAKKPPKGRQVTLEKRLVEHGTSAPDSAPMFVNHFQVVRHEGDWFIDVGVIPADDVLKQAESVHFLVSQRLAMSLHSVKKLRDLIDEVLEKAGEASSGTLSTAGQSVRAKKKAGRTRNGRS